MQIVIPLPSNHNCRNARMAESVDALVSNTNVRKDVPVRPRLRVGFLILAGCTKGVLFREKSQRKVKNPAKFCVWLQRLRTQNDRANLPVPAPSPMSNRTGLAKIYICYIPTSVLILTPHCLSAMTQRSALAMTKCHPVFVGF